jgi:hypothetical protein
MFLAHVIRQRLAKMYVETDRCCREEQVQLFGKSISLKSYNMDPVFKHTRLYSPKRDVLLVIFVVCGVPTNTHEQCLVAITSF